MPKGKRKGKSVGGTFVKQRTAEVIATSDEDSLNDNASIISYASESTVHEEAVAGEESEEPNQDDVFEEKLVEAIDGMSQKSAQGRTNCLEAVATAFTKKYLPDFVLCRRLTLSDGIERCLKKGRGTEQAAAAQLSALLCVQLGAGEMTDEVCRDLSPLLAFIANDTSMSPSARAKCCWALGLLSFLANTDDLVEAMTTLEHIYSASFRKGDGSLPSVPTELAGLHSAALSAWSLLLTVVDVQNATTDLCLSQLSGLLDSAHLEVRLSAGEAIALLLEAGRAGDGSGDGEGADNELTEKLRQLATDSHKYRAKKDRKQQRSSFRDILRFVESDVPPNIQVRFGQEALSLDSWSRKKQYDAFCQVLGSGMNRHLMENDLLRDVLELGEKLSPLNMAQHKQSKLERHLMNAAAFKARSISRAKNRDKRSAVIAS